MLLHVPLNYLHRRFDFYSKSFIPHANKVKLSACLVVPLLIFVVPLEWIPLEGLTVIHQRAMAIFFLAALFWIFEPIPIFATSILVLFLELVLLSDSALAPALQGQEATNFGSLMRYQEIMATLASPIIILFLGGFFLAISATKYGLDHKMARFFITPFGTKPRWVMLGIMTITATFSMFMSNTATTAMMLSILVPVLASMDEGDKGKIGFVLSVPIAANLGGIGTPIGTPPNAIALTYLAQEFDMTFSKWMLIGVPIVVLMVLISWFFLMRLYPTSTQHIRLHIKPGPRYGHKPLIIYATFALTVLLWLTDFIHGLNAYVVAMLPIVVFLCGGVLTKEDLKLISWDVLWLVAGGIALGLALTSTGLAQVFVSNIPFADFPLGVLFLVTAGMGILVANFMSNTATANLLIPMIAVIASSVPAFDKLGGGGILILTATLAISLGMCLPISTPPNALAYGTGMITTRHLLRSGLFTGGVGLILVFVLLLLYQKLEFL
ncbi:SLC13 family permease [Cesiribacter andamanensis]|uniref:Na(+)/dicarboxylate symporter n=1 Tax=Cesiribacter andamanensis AMV16 TaxID=1279009 RepID=M7NVF5_9BACT|nr:DASS family sodium-coupled anion symporter [Cesiribacter andamanensis]EMR02454.1 Na(+)/dicarboxylate symporter [Cesiribacter andamanensis AMV16]